MLIVINLKCWWQKSAQWAQPSVLGKGMNICSIKMHVDVSQYCGQAFISAVGMWTYFLLTFIVQTFLDDCGKLHLARVKWSLFNHFRIYFLAEMTKYKIPKISFVIWSAEKIIESPWNVRLPNYRIHFFSVVFLFSTLFLQIIGLLFCNHTGTVRVSCQLSQSCVCKSGEKASDVFTGSTLYTNTLQ